MSILIEVKKNGRYFFLCEYENRVQLTWKKDFAKQFETEESALEYIKTNRIFYCIKLIPFTEAKSH